MPHCEEMVALNTKLKIIAMNPNRDNDSECPTKLIARNVRLRETTLNVVIEKTWWL